MQTVFNIYLSKHELLIMDVLITLSESETITTYFSTKEISSISGLNIYQTRYTLLKLVEKGVVLKSGDKPKYRKMWTIAMMGLDGVKQVNDEQGIFKKDVVCLNCPQ